MMLVVSAAVVAILLAILGPPWVSWLDLIVYVMVGSLIVSVTLMFEDVAPRRVEIKPSGVDFVYLSKKVAVSWADLHPSKVPTRPLTNLVRFVDGSEDKVWPNYLWVTKSQAAALFEAIQSTEPGSLSEPVH